MLLFTITFGGLLLMMGHHPRAESLFYYFRLEDQVPENHLLLWSANISSARIMARSNLHGSRVSQRSLSARKRP